MITEEKYIPEVLSSYDLKWNVFDVSELEIIAIAVGNGRFDDIAAALMDLNPEKHEVIQSLLNLVRPKSFSFESEVQKEFEARFGSNVNGLTPEVEAEYQRRIEEEKAEKIKAMSGGLVEDSTITVDEEGGSGVSVTVTNDLYKVKGLGEASVNKLINAGIDSIDKFKALGHEEKVKVVGPVVAAKFLEN